MTVVDIRKGKGMVPMLTHVYNLRLRPWHVLVCMAVTTMTITLMHLKNGTQLDSIDGEEQNGLVTPNTEVSYQVNGPPILIDQRSGWIGATLDDGVNFCRSRVESESQLCSFDMYCRRTAAGRRAKLSLNKEFDRHEKNRTEDWPEELWSPAMSGNVPVWVGVGIKNECQQRSPLEKFPTNTMKHVMCCHKETELLPDLTTNWFEPSLASNGETDKEYELLVLVLAGGTGERHSWLENIWLKIVREVRRLGLPVRIYLMKNNPDIDEPLLIGDQNLFIEVPGHNSVENCLDMTVRSIELIHRAKLPGHRHRYLLRTNISSMWCFPKYLKYIDEKYPHGSQKVYDGIIGENGPKGILKFVGGTGFLLSPDLERLLVNDQGHLHYEIIDDVAIGELLLEHHSFAATNGKRQDFTSLEDLKNIRTDYFTVNEDHFHFRVKSRSKTENILQDKLVSSHLLMHCYGENMTNT